MPIDPASAASAQRLGVLPTEPAPIVNLMGIVDMDEYSAFLLAQMQPARLALVDQLLAGCEKPDFVRGQIKGLDRAIEIIKDGSRKFLVSDDEIEAAAYNGDAKRGRSYGHRQAVARG